MSPDLGRMLSRPGQIVVEGANTTSSRVQFAFSTLTPAPTSFQAREGRYLTQNSRSFCTGILTHVWSLRNKDGPRLSLMARHQDAEAKYLQLWV